MRHLTIAAAVLVLLWQPESRASVQPGVTGVSGVVVTDTNSEVPVPRAIVTVSGAPLTIARTTVTGADGQFRIDDLPPGRYIVKAEKASFITTEYGAKRPGRPGVAVQIGNGEPSRHLTIPLARGAVVAGVVRDQSGFPVSSATVSVVPLIPERSDNPRSLTNNGVRTNQDGEYRVFGLEPGAYLVRVSPPASDGGVSVLSEMAIDRLLDFLRGRRPLTPDPSSDPDVVGRSVAFTPIYFPNTPDPAAATPVRLVTGEERLGVDIALEQVPVATIEGAVMLEDGVPAVGASVFLRRPAADGPLPSAVPSAVATDKSGHFRLSDVVPGQYRLLAQVRDSRGAPAGTIDAESTSATGRWASMLLSVGGTHITGLRLDVRPGLTLNGRVELDRSSRSLSSAPALAGLRPVLYSDKWGISTSVQASADGSFAISGLPAGRYRLRVNADEIQGWFLRSAMVGDTDMLEMPVELVDGAVHAVVVTFSDQETQLAGRFQARGNQGVSDIVIIAFSADSRFWRAGSRRIRTVRPATDGSFEFRNMVAGEYHLAALVDVDPDEWLQSGYLDALKPSSVAVRLEAGSRHVQNLIVQGR